MTIEDLKPVAIFLLFIIPSAIFIDGVTVEEIKEKLLHKFINMSVSFKHEIQNLFKENI